MNDARKKNYRKLRAALIRRGTNLRRFAAERGYPYTTVYCAAAGTRSGIVATRIFDEITSLISNPPNSRSNSTNESAPTSAPVLSGEGN